MIDTAAIEAEIRRRADWHLKQTHLFVDYYRVRRRLAYPLPVRAFHISEIKVRRDYSRDYPWATWMTWALEERIACLSFAGHSLDNAACREAAARDVEALASWPAYRQYDKPDLSLGHAARTLYANVRYKWLDDRVRSKIKEAFARIVADALPFSDKLHGAFKTKEDVLNSEKPVAALHNIPIIGTIGAALAAREIGHEAMDVFDTRLFALLGALLDMRKSGFTEGVAYDDYVLDFAADWLGALPEDRRAPILEHPRLKDFLEQSYMLAAPGDAVEVVEMSDVEPREMPFHLSAQAKLQMLKKDRVRAWHLSRCDPTKLRAEALVTLRYELSPVEPLVPPAGALDAHYALVLRSGWEANDVAVAVSASNSPMGHMHCDAGSIALGSRGMWLIADPGYQQYMNTREREFTLGVKAHNAPVIGGKAQDRKGVKRLGLEDRNGVLRAELDLTACYPPELKLEAVKRAVWLVDKRIAIVADRVRGEGGKPAEALDYYWHGHAAAAWWVQDRWARVYHPEAPDAAVWVASPQARIQEEGVDRLPGSRGQMTLSTPADPNAPTVWWIFAVGAKPLEPKAEGGRLRLGDWVFEID
ncbi:MAG: heparinase II/III family protein [Planctomycetes bacterium]|nr:heparinase II/III family protein [Planctomycetota bacterium]